MLCLMSLAALAGGPTEIELGYGAATRVSDDELFSDRPYTGVSPIHGALALRRDGEKLHHEVELQFALTRMRAFPSYTWQWETDRDPVTIPGSPFVRVDLSWQVAAPVHEGPVDVQVGAAWRNRIGSRNHDYGDIGVFGYLGTFGLGPYVRVASERGDWAASTELEVMALGWGTRSPWGINDSPYVMATRDHNAVKTIASHIGRGRPITAVSTQQVQLSGAVARRLSDVWSASLRVDAQLFHERHPQPLTDLVVTPRLGLSARF